MLYFKTNQLLLQNVTYLLIDWTYRVLSIDVTQAASVIFLSEEILFFGNRENKILLYFCKKEK